MHTLLTTLLISLLLLASGSADAKQVARDAPDFATAAVYEEALQSNGVSLSQAVEQVRRQYKGRIVSAETKVSSSGETHVIKVLTEDGKVKTVRIAGKPNG